MFAPRLNARIARSIVALLAAGFIQLGTSAPVAHAAPPIEPTITSSTSGATSITVNLSTSGISASSWRYIVTRRLVTGCANPGGDGVVQSTGSLTSSIQVTGLTAGCYYTVKVAGYNGVIGTYAAVDKLVGGYSSVLNVIYQNDAGTGTGILRTPITTGCHTTTVSQINGITFADGTGPSGCNSTYYTGYFYGYIKAPYTGTITFKMATNDAGVLAIQGNTIAVVTSSTSATGTFEMVQGEVYRFEEWFHNDTGASSNTVSWSYTGQAEQVIPAGNFANDPSVLASDGGCTLGMAARCAAGSALEIKRATGTNTDGQYWIRINGTPTLVYCVMNSSQGGGGWMLAMRGKNSASTFQYNSSYWTDSTLLNSTYPDRFSTSDTVRNTDAKYAPFTSTTGNQVMVLFPEVTTYAGGAFGTNGGANATGVNGAKYGFAWHETFTAGSVWTAYNSTTKWGGNSYNIAQTGGPTATPTCVNNPSTLTYLFSTASRCAFRQVQSNYNSAEVPYSAVGNNVFFSQTDVRFFGINYGNGSTSFITKSRIGFGWNENGGGEETSNDGNGGIGTYSSNSTTFAAGTYNGCCSADNHLNPGQTGMSGGNGTTTQLGFELYVRNAVEISVAGNGVLRVTKGRSTSMVAANPYYASGNTGTTNFSLSSNRPGFGIDSVTGVITVSEGLPIGSYTTTVTAGDANNASGSKTVTIQVVADSSETDTALSFDGSSQSLTSGGTIGLWADQTWEAWVKPTSECSQGTNATFLGSGNFVMFCNGSSWWLSFKDSGGSWNGYKTTEKVVKNEWVHLAVVRSGSTITFYANNRQAKIFVSNSWVDSYTQSIYQTFVNVWIGGTGSAGQYFQGLIDEVKLWSEARTLTQIWSGAHTSENLSSSGLLMYWDFNEGTGSAISRSQRANDNFNLTPSSSSQWVSVATTTQVGVYTRVYVPRTLINRIGGWRAPDSLTAITVLVLGGGGGGGGGYEGGGGGAGGFQESTVNVAATTVYSIKVGVGGFGATNPVAPTNGESSTAFGLTSVGGGSGMAEFTVGAANVQYPAGAGGSGGGGSHGTIRTGGSGTSGQGNDGAYGRDIWGTCAEFAGGGGGGAGSAGFEGICTDPAASNTSHGGYGGSPKLSQVMNKYYAGGGGGSLRDSNGTALKRGQGGNGDSTTAGDGSYTTGALVGATGGATNAPANSGGGGGAGNSTDGTTGYGGNGGSGLVVFRYITATKPTFTQPTNTYLNVGMTETFTTNVAQDSATVGLTRTFRWESTTAGETGTYSLIKEGTGAAYASMSWVPSDTSTSGSKYLYRVIITDSDTAGLFIRDTSTAVFATINRALILTGKSTLTKTVNIAKTETFSVTDGTPTYSYSLLPTSSNFWLDTSTAGSPKIKFADTVTVGTYYETFTITDSVSATIVQPLTIVVSPPPSFSANAAQVDSGTILYLDAGNTTSYSGTGTSWVDLSGRNLSTSLQPTGMTSTNGGPTSCTKVGYSPEALGVMTFTSSSKTCAYTTGLGVVPIYTAQVWVKRDGPIANDYISVIATPWNTSKQINITLHWMKGDVLEAGIFRNDTWPSATGFATSPVIPNKTWVFATVTFDGTTLKLTTTVDGVSTSDTGIPNSLAFDGNLIIPNLIIGKRFDLDNASTGNYYFNGSIGSIRIYNRVLSDSEILQNYNSTKGRFLLTQNKSAISGKYGTTVNETYTVTAGSETITASFTSNAVAGLVWDTSTVRSMKVQLQDSLSAGTYNDTITVTDIYGSSTKIPLTFTVAKADTITVYIDTPTAVSYTGSAANFPTVLKVSGLVSSDTGTAVTISYKPGNLTCATGGSCAIGDIGPGGGIVFITPSTAGGNGKYFEAAPANWSGTDDIASVGKFCTAGTSQDGISRGASQVGIGWGETNTALFDSNCTGGAVRQVVDYAGGGYTDWFIPSTNEATQLYTYSSSVGLLKLGSAWSVGTWGYWASTEQSGTQMKAIQQSAGNWTLGATEKSDSTHNMVRPVRMFSPCWAVDTCTSLSTSTKPTNAGTYVIVPSALTLTTGSLENYVGVKYDTSTVTINRIAQEAQLVPYQSNTFPETFTVNVAGGSGNGALTYTVANGSATGCAFDYKKLYATSQGSCAITVYKAGDRNYLPDTATSSFLFVTFLTNQPAPVAGTGPTIALGGQTSLTLDLNVAPTISSITYVAAFCIMSFCTPEHWEISGAGFGAANNLDTVVKFWRNKVVTMTTNSSDNHVAGDGSIEIWTVPSGASTGKIMVITANGIAVSATNWIAP